MAHYMMMMLFLAGPSEGKAAVPVSVEAELYRANAIESADTVCVRVQTETGIPLLFYGTHASIGLRDPEIEIRGTRGAILWSNDGSVVIRPEAGSAQELHTDLNDLRRRMLQTACDVVHGVPAFFCDLAMASLHTMVVSAVHGACAIHSLKGQTLRGDRDSDRIAIPGIDEATIGP
jgi:hypothetical protein